MWIAIINFFIFMLLVALFFYGLILWDKLVCDSHDDSSEDGWLEKDNKTNKNIYLDKSNIQNFLELTQKYSNLMLLWLFLFCMLILSIFDLLYEYIKYMI